MLLRRCPYLSPLNHPVPAHADGRGSADLGLTVLVLMPVDDQFQRGPGDAVRMHLLVRGHLLKLTHHYYGAMYSLVQLQH